MRPTLDWLEQHMTSGIGVARRQLEALGEPWPPTKGWKHRACQRDITNEQHIIFETGGKKSSPAGDLSRGRRSREENVTLAEVLAKHDSGPTSGVFTDGSAQPNPGPGGWGVVWVEGGEIQDQRHGHDPNTTNNRMELTALIEAYRLLPEDATARVLTDSQLCVNTITKWAAGWARRGWRRKGDKPIKNLALVQELFALYQAHPRCNLSWIAAHSGYRWNEYADSLATAWMRSEL